MPLPVSKTLTPLAVCSERRHLASIVVNTVHSDYYTFCMCHPNIYFERNTWQVANGWRRSFPRKQNMFEFNILFPYLGCVRSVLAAGHRLYMSAQCATGIFLYLYKSGNQWNITTSTWKCCATAVLSEFRKWSTNLHFEVIFLIAQLRRSQLFISWMWNYDIKQSATNLRFNGWKRRDSYFSRKTLSKFHEICALKACPDTCAPDTCSPDTCTPDTWSPDTLYLLGLWNTPKKSRQTSLWPIQLLQRHLPRLCAALFLVRYYC